MNRRQSLEKGILSPPGPFLTPSPSPSVQHSPRLQPSPSQSPFQQDVLLVTNSSQHFINTFNTTQEQDRKSGTPNRRLSISQISPNAGTIAYRPSPSQSPAGFCNTSNVGNEFNTTLVGSNNISLNKKGKRTPQHAGQYGATSNSCSPKASKKTMGLLGSPIASPSPSPTLSSQPIIQQFPIMNANNSIVFMQQPASNQRPSIIQSSNTQTNVYTTTNNSGTGTLKHNKAPQQILPKPAALSVSSSSSSFSSSLSNPSIITSATSTKQVVTQSKMAIVQQSHQTQQFQSPPHQINQQVMTSSSTGNGSSPSPQPHQIAQSGSILLPSGAQPLLLNQMPVLVQQNTSQGVQLILRPPSAPQLAAPSLVIHNRPSHMQQHQPQQLLRILNTNGGMQLATATATPTFIVSSQANIIQQNLQSIKTSAGGTSQINQISGMQQAQQQNQRQPQQIINSHILGQSVAQIQNLQLNGNLTQIQMPNGQFIQQLPAQFQQNISGFNQIQPLGSQLSAIATNAAFQSPPSSSNQNDLVPTVVSTSPPNQIQFATNQQNISMAQGTQIISPVATPQPQMIQSEQSILSSPSITFNSQPQTAVILTGDKQIHEISSPPPQVTNYSIIHQSGTNEMITLDMSQHQQQNQNLTQVTTKPPRKPKKSKKQKALEQAQLQQQQQQIQMTQSQAVEQPTVMMSPPRNSQGPTGKLDLANVMKLCGIMEDDDFMDSDEPQMETMENQNDQTQTIHMPSNASGNENNSGDIMITIPGGSADQPFTFTIPSSSLESGEGAIIQGTSNDGKISNNMPFMIRFDPGDAQNGGQPYTISIPNLTEENVIEDGKGNEISSITPSSSAATSMCVPSFVNSVLNSSVTPTIQSQINEIQNQLMALPPVTTAKVSAKAPRQKKQTTKKTKKQLEKTMEVPKQIGNIQISQIDGTTVKNAMGNKNMNNINNQIQIMPIIEKCHPGGNNSGQMIEKQKMQVPVLQQTISHQNNQNNNNQQHHHQQQNTQGSHSNSVPSQVNINVQQNQLINVTNNLQMQVIANPQQQQHNSGATPAHAPPTSSSSGHHTQAQNSVVTSQALNTQNLIGNIINAQQGQQGNIIIQGGSFNHQQQQSMPANIQVNIQNQTIANNIITTAPVNQNHVPPSSQHQQQPTAQSILSQLTGNLVLSLSEDNRLILRHDPNIPQDAQSQMILQTILTGALGNVSLINEPLKTPVQTQNHQPNQQHHVIGSNGKIQHMTSVHNKNVIISSQPQHQSQPQQIFNNVVHSHSLPGHVIQNNSQQSQLQSTKMENSGNQQAVVVPNPNILKFVELPKIQPNQQLFSLNTLTNEITQLNPNQTTAALSPMERLLIVPSGINAQQLAQCLSQGQIHFNNIGQAPTSDPNKVQQQLHIQQQQQIINKSSNVQKTSNHYIKKEPVEPKPKKGRGKKAKLLEEQQKMEIKKEPMIQSPPPIKMISIADTKMIKTTSMTTSVVTTTINSSTKNTITISPNPSLMMNQVKVTPKVSQLNSNAKANQKQTSISVIPSTTATSVHNIQKVNAIKAGKNHQIKTAMAPQLSPISQQQVAPPPLVSVNQAPVPRVQTIQLTPQKQQSLKNVQMSIQQLSAKLQNKSLLATLTADVDPNNPVHNNPLPVLNNINAMSDGEIYNALQRLFVEQQKILATGKIIPTIPAAAAAAVSPQINNASSQQSPRNLQNTGTQPQPMFANNAGIVAPITSTSSGGSALYNGGNSQTIPSPIQVNSPIVKQEPPCSASTSISQPPPLVVSTPIQMQIKTEVLLSPSNASNIVSTTSPPATGSIIISPKYTTSNKITIDPPKEHKILSETKKEVVVPVTVQAPEVTIDPASVIKQQQIAAAIEANRKQKIGRSSLFERQICVDQEGCTHPDYKSDFSTKEDAVKRLIRYHCLYDEVKDEHDPKEDFEFEQKAKVFLASYQVMREKYQRLLMKQSQQFAPTSELMMLDRLRVADLKDEIVSMQSELNSVLFEQHQKSQLTIKNEVMPPALSNLSFQPNTQVQNTPASSSASLQSNYLHSPQTSQRVHVPIMQEPSQILKAKQEQKLFENIKNEKVKIEATDIPKDVNKPIYGSAAAFNYCQASASPKPPSSPSSQQKLTKFDKLKNESINVNSIPRSQQAQQLHQSSTMNKNSQHKPPVKPSTDLKEELDDFDIESEIRPNLIMKKCDSMQQAAPVVLQNVNKKSTKQKEKEREFSPLSDYFNSKMGSTSKNKNEIVKNDTQDGTYDEWLSIQKELNLQLTGSTSSTSKKKDVGMKSGKVQPKILDNDLSEIFEQHSSPKSVEKQLDDLFSSTSKSSDLLAVASPLTEFFHVEPTNMNEKTVETRLEALFGEADDDSRKSNQQDLVETRLEQLFQGSVAENDESALDNASFLYKNTDMTYEMIQKQVHVSTSAGDNVNTSNSNKRQWSGGCDMFASANSSMLFPTSTSPASKRACTAAPSVAFDNKWIEDSFDFATEIMSTETSGDEIAKHRNWNGNMAHQETMIGGIQSPQHNQFHLSSNDTSNMPQIQNQNIQQTDQHMNLMDNQMNNLNYDDVDDISRQVQNAIDSILNLQSSDPLHYQLDSSFLELNTITGPSTGAPNSPVNMQQSHSHQIQNPQHIEQQYQMHPRTDHQVNSMHGFNNLKQSNLAKRKYSRMDDIGDCLIGGSNLDDSPSALALTEPHSVEPSAASVGEFVNNLLSCEEKSITTS